MVATAYAAKERAVVNLGDVQPGRHCRCGCRPNVQDAAAPFLIGFRMSDSNAGTSVGQVGPQKIFDIEGSAFRYTQECVRHDGDDGRIPKASEGVITLSDAYHSVRVMPAQAIHLPPSAVSSLASYAC
jgi:hypothetical protein